MQQINGRNINQIVYKVLNEINENGYRSSSRNGEMTALYDVSLKFENPRSRHLNLDGRTNNIFATIGEIFWVMAGEDNIEDFLSYFIPRAPNYSDDGGRTWSAAYGERMYAYDQIQNAVDMFTVDGKMTRRSTLSIFDPARDTLQAYKDKGIESPKDIPCNQWINFFITPDDKLNMKVIQRSGDIIFGTGNINLPEFSVLQELVLQMVQKTYPEVTLGYYNHSVTNLHLYDFTASQSGAILNNSQILTRDNNTPCIFPDTAQKSKEFFKELVDLFAVAIKQENKCEFLHEDILTIFETYRVKSEDNMLFGYALAIRAYIVHTHTGEEFDFTGYNYSGEFLEALKNNHFNKGIIK